MKEIKINAEESIAKNIKVYFKGKNVMASQLLKNKLAYCYDLEIDPQKVDKRWAEEVFLKEDIKNAVEYLKEQIRSSSSDDFCCGGAFNYAAMINIIDDAFEDVIEEKE